MAQLYSAGLVEGKIQTQDATDVRGNIAILNPIQLCQKLLKEIKKHRRRLKNKKIERWVYMMETALLQREAGEAEEKYAAWLLEQQKDNIKIVPEHFVADAKYDFGNTRIEVKAQGVSNIYIPLVPSKNKEGARYRGLSRVRIQAYLAVTASNLKKWFKYITGRLKNGTLKTLSILAALRVEPQGKAIRPPTGQVCLPVRQAGPNTA